MKIKELLGYLQNKKSVLKDNYSNDLGILPKLSEDTTNGVAIRLYANLNMVKESIDELSRKIEHLETLVNTGNYRWVSYININEDDKTQLEEFKDRELKRELGATKDDLSSIEVNVHVNKIMEVVSVDNEPTKHVYEFNIQAREIDIAPEVIPEDDVPGIGSLTITQVDAMAKALDITYGQIQAKLHAKKLNSTEKKKCAAALKMTYNEFNAMYNKE